MPEPKRTWTSKTAFVQRFAIVGPRGDRRISGFDARKQFPDATLANLYDPLAMPWPHDVAVSRAAIYAAFCCFQQYLMQSYFYRRLSAVFHSPHLSAAAAALMFAGAHVPNLLLMAATLVGGFILSEVFARHANIWPLALVQFAGGLLIAAVVPASITHQMRVGPGYYSWRPVTGK